MNYAHLAQYVNLAIGIALIVKLLLLRLHRVYLTFCCFLAADLLGSALWLTRSLPLNPLRYVDYRVIWLSDRLLAWVFTAWTIFSLLDAVLSGFSGIARMSRTVFRWSLLICVAFALISALPEYAVSGAQADGGWLQRSTIIGLVMERVVASAALLVTLSVLGFLLWFPKQIPRNLARFLIGFIIFFIVNNIALLARSFWSHQLVDIGSMTASVVTGACFAYWLLFLSQAGELVQTSISVHWSNGDQHRLMEQLEGLNRSLLRAAKR